MRKRVCSIVAVMAMAALALQGCGASSAPDVMKKAYENTMGHTVSISADGEVHLTADTEAFLKASGASDEASMTLVKLFAGNGLNLDMDIEGKLENGKAVSHTTTVMSMSLFGLNQTSKTETYSADLEDRVYSYSSNDGGEWKMSVSPLPEKDTPLFVPEELSGCFSFREKDKKNVTEEIDGKTCYVLEGTLTEETEELAAYLGNISALNDAISALEVKDLEASVVCYVDKKDMRPVRLKADVKGADLTLTAESGSFDVALDGTSFTIDYEEWGIADPVVPKEAAAIAESGTESIME